MESNNISLIQKYQEEEETKYVNAVYRRRTIGICIIGGLGIIGLLAAAYMTNKSDKNIPTNTKPITNQIYNNSVHK